MKGDTVHQEPDLGSSTTNAIFLETTGNNRLGREEQLMAAYAKVIGLQIHLATAKQVERRKVLVPDGAVAIGGVTFIRNVLRQFGLQLPEHTPYPAALTHLLYRQVKRLPALRDAKALLDAGQRLFIKPAEGWKRFTGFVAEFSDDHRFAGASKSDPVWVSEVLHLKSEWRAYVVGDRVLDVRLADFGGAPTTGPDMDVIAEAVALLHEAQMAPAGYVIDFGVTTAGQTVLIELNDGFSFGAYDGVPAEIYWKVTQARWQQLTAAPKINLAAIATNKE